jgi:hypothetical protein
MTHAAIIARLGLFLVLLKQGFTPEKTRGPDGQSCFVQMVLACIQNARQCVRIYRPKPSFDIPLSKQFAVISFPNSLGSLYAPRFVSVMNARSQNNLSSLALRPSGFLPVESCRDANQGPIQGRTSVLTQK